MVHLWNSFFSPAPADNQATLGPKLITYTPRIHHHEHGTLNQAMHITTDAPSQLQEFTWCACHVTTSLPWTPLTYSVVLFLPHPQNRARKSLCNLRTLKPHCVDFTRQQQLLTFFLRGTVCVLLIKYINQILRGGGCFCVSIFVDG